MLNRTFFKFNWIYTIHLFMASFDVNYRQLYIGMHIVINQINIVNISPAIDF